MSRATGACASGTETPETVVPKATKTSFRAFNGSGSPPFLEARQARFGDAARSSPEVKATDTSMRQCSQEMGKQMVIYARVFIIAQGGPIDVHSRVLQNKPDRCRYTSTIDTGHPPSQGARGSENGDAYRPLPGIKNKPTGLPQ